MLALFLFFPVAMVAVGYWWGKEHAVEPEMLAVSLQQELESQRSDIKLARQEAEEDLNALAMRLGRLQAHVTRLDALGDRLTHMAKLDDGEFDFSSSPAQGGPEEANVAATIGINDFIAQLETLSEQLEDREGQLSVLQDLLLSKNLLDEVMPAGRPSNSGWISSKFGTRTDPFTGKPAWHRGVDIAAKEGGDVIAVAAGLVTYAGKRYGYGNLVEITHGNGYVTRYGHNSAIAVKVGETVKKGQKISSVGNTGRSTGPHIHFEVWVNGKAVDPMKYITAVR
jgi:murein DD-endopeptidase MepM/ murein hydrolase activator NlpD